LVSCEYYFVPVLRDRKGGKREREGGDFRLLPERPRLYGVFHFDLRPRWTPTWRRGKKKGGKE